MIELNNLTNFVVDKNFFAALAKKVLKGENREMENLSLAFVSSKEIQKINKKYRKKNKPTDVLSFEKVFHFKDNFSEVIICPEVVKQSLKNPNKAIFKKELAKVLTHGILHTLGYDHEVSKAEEERMNKKQGYYLSQVR